MPGTSHYISVEEEFAKRAKGDDGAPRMENYEFAKGVVQAPQKPGAEDLVWRRRFHNQVRSIMAPDIVASKHGAISFCF